MGTTTDKLQHLLATKAAIKSSIEDKGVAVGEIPFAEYPARIAEIEGGGGETPVYQLEYLEITEAGFVRSRVSVTPGEVVTLKPGRNVPETNTGSKDYIPALVFMGWACSLPVVENTITIPENITSNIDINAVYDTTDGRCCFVLNITRNNSISANSAATQINISSSGAGTTSVDWGDGTIDTFTATNSQSIPHDYTNYGVKIVQVYTDRSTRTIGFGGSSNSMIFGNNIPATKSALVRAWLGSSVTTVGDSTFNTCTGLLSVTLPQGIEAISNNVFNNCYALTDVIIPAGISGIGATAFYNCNSLQSIVLPQGITTVLYNAFYNCNKLTSLALPEGVVSIANGVFNGCNALTSVMLPTTLTSIGYNLFYNCNSLTSFTLPSGLTSLGYNAFYNCNSLVSVVLPGNLTTLDNGTFNGCSSLVSVVLPAGLTTIGDSGFSGCNTLTSVTLPAGVTSLGSNVFSNCYSLAVLNLPAGLTTLGDYAFRNCYSLYTLALPGTLTAIGREAIRDCKSLAHLTLPAGLPDIQSNTFNGNTALETYTFSAPVPPTLIDMNAFTGINSATRIYVPAASLEAYRTATNWTTYANYMIADTPENRVLYQD